MHLLSGWENFYVIVGSSAGALIGLQFVVMTLIADIPTRHNADQVAQAGNAFATPTIIHFSAVLLLSGVMSAPWQSVALVATIWAIIGLAGMVYCGVTTRRMKLQQAYQPEFEDWLFHSLLPFLAYTMLPACSLLTMMHVRGALFSVAGAAMLLLFIGIHNAWDAVTYHVLVVRPKEEKTTEKSH
jgi:hypothetical protein